MPKVTFYDTNIRQGLSYLRLLEDIVDIVALQMSGSSASDDNHQRHQSDRQEYSCREKVHLDVNQKVAPACHKRRIMRTNGSM